MPIFRMIERPGRENSDGSTAGVPLAKRRMPSAQPVGGPKDNGSEDANQPLAAGRRLGSSSGRT